jgi:hypothetical protein
MIDARFSKDAFEALRKDLEGLENLTKELEDEVMLRLRPMIAEELARVATELNRLGHNLEPVDHNDPGELEVCEGAPATEHFGLWISHASQAFAGYAGLYVRRVDTRVEPPRCAFCALPIDFRDDVWSELEATWVGHDGCWLLDVHTDCVLGAIGDDEARAWLVADPPDSQDE